MRIFLYSRQVGHEMNAGLPQGSRLTTKAFLKTTFVVTAVALVLASGIGDPAPVMARDENSVAKSLSERIASYGTGESSPDPVEWQNFETAQQAELPSSVGKFNFKLKSLLSLPASPKEERRVREVLADNKPRTTLNRPKLVSSVLRAQKSTESLTRLVQDFEVDESFSLEGDFLVGSTIYAPEVFIQPTPSKVTYQWLADGRSLGKKARKPSLSLKWGHWAKEIGLTITFSKKGFNPYQVVLNSGEYVVGEVEYWTTWMDGVDYLTYCDGWGYRTCDQDPSGYISGNYYGARIYTNGAYSYPYDEWVYGVWGFEWPDSDYGLVTRWKVQMAGFGGVGGLLLNAAGPSLLDSEDADYSTFIRPSKIYSKKKPLSSEWSTTSVDSGSGYFGIYISDWGSVWPGYWNVTYNVLE